MCLKCIEPQDFFLFAFKRHVETKSHYVGGPHFSEWGGGGVGGCGGCGGGGVGHEKYTPGPFFKLFLKPFPK